MKIKSNGIEKEITVLKHFKIINDEYILYKDKDIISVGLISENKIIIPSSDKLSTLKPILGSIVNNNPNDCVILDNNINITLEEISVQHIKLTDTQLNNLIETTVNNTTTINNTSNKKDKKNIIIIILICIIVVLIGIGLVFMFKPKKNTNSSKEKEIVQTKLEEDQRINEKTDEKLNILKFTYDTGKIKSSSLEVIDDYRFQMNKKYYESNDTRTVEMVGTYECYEESCNEVTSDIYNDLVIIEDKYVVIYDYKNNKAYNTDIIDEGNQRTGVGLFTDKNNKLIGIAFNYSKIKGKKTENSSNDNVVYSTRPQDLNSEYEYEDHTSYFKYENGKFYKVIDNVTGEIILDSEPYYQDNVLIIRKNKKSALYNADTGKKIIGTDTDYFYDTKEFIDSTSLKQTYLKVLQKSEENVNKTSDTDYNYIYSYDVLNDNNKRIFNEFYNNINLIDNKIYAFNDQAKEYKIYDMNTKKISTKTTNYPIFGITYNYIVVIKNNKLVITDYNNKELKEIVTYNNKDFYSNKIYYLKKESVKNFEKNLNVSLGDGNLVIIEGNDIYYCYDIDNNAVKEVSTKTLDDAVINKLTNN